MSVRVLALALIALCGVPTPGAAQSGEEDAVMAVVTTLFDGMREKDRDKLSSVWHQEARLQSAGRDRDGNRVVATTPVEAFMQSIVSMAPKIDEVTFDERVFIDGDLAMVWAPYNVFVDGEFRHCGVDAFQMVRTDEGWKILQLADTRTQEGCDPSRKGG